MLFHLRCNILVSVIAVQLCGTVTSQENQMTRHEGHHDKRKMRWDNWTEWTECSAECGRGVTSRSRDCRSMLDGRVIEGCSGRGNEIKLCDIKGCIKVAEDEEECKKLEERVFGGKRYRWKPYKHPRDQCQLACRPVGGAFYIEVGKNVSDGLPCAVDRDNVCISGKCKPLGCDNVVESGTKKDDCGVCGGDSSTCSRVSKTFTDSVKFGYHTLVTIPRGATNIAISEGVGGRNYLGVRATDESFSINSDFRLSRFGNIPGAGTIFKYSRQSGPDCPDECIKAAGPIDVSVDVIVLFYTSNSGITYSYNLPSDQVDQQNNNQEDEGSISVHIDGGSLPEKLGVGVQDSPKVKGGKKRPLFSSDFKFKNSGRRRKHRHQRKHNAHRDNASRRSKNINITGDTGALQTPKTKTQSTVANDNDYNLNNIKITYKNQSVVVEYVNKTDNKAAQPHANNNQANVGKTRTVPSNSNPSDKTDSIIAQAGNNDKDDVDDDAIIVEDDVGDVAAVDDADEGSEEDDDPNEVGESKEGDQGEIEDDEVNEADDEDKTAAPGPASANNLTDADMNSNDNQDASPYSWRHFGYTQCSRTCGAGEQSPIIQCIVVQKLARVDDSFCEDLEKPSVVVLSCSNGDCPATWTARTWSKCSVTCGLGTQSRDYICQGSEGQEAAEGVCGSPKPAVEERTCDLGSCAFGWYYTEWEKECVAHCGFGTLTRRVHCSSDSGNINTACNKRDKPEVTKSCRNDDCGGFWVTGPWSKCNATCGMAYQTRSVACAQKHRDRVSIVTDSACQDEERPQTYMSCDLDSCGPNWFMADWGECAVTCGSGQRSRDVRCLDDDYNPSSDCDASAKPSERETCSSNRPCPLSDESVVKADNPSPTKKPKSAQKGGRGEEGSKEGGVKRTENVVSPTGCVDKFPQCVMVVKANLCQYRYYQKICCAACYRVRHGS